MPRTLTADLWKCDPTYYGYTWEVSTSLLDSPSEPHVMHRDLGVPSHCKPDEFVERFSITLHDCDDILTGIEAFAQSEIETDLEGLLSYLIMTTWPRDQESFGLVQKYKPDVAIINDRNLPMCVMGPAMPAWEGRALWKGTLYVPDQAGQFLDGFASMEILQPMLRTLIRQLTRLGYEIGKKHGIIS